MLELFLAEKWCKGTQTNKMHTKNQTQKKLRGLQETSAVKRKIFIAESYYLQLHSYPHCFVSSEEGAALNAKSSKHLLDILKYSPSFGNCQRTKNRSEVENPISLLSSTFSDYINSG